MRALGKAVRQGFLPTCERSYRDFWLPMLDYNTPAYNNKTKEMPFEREPSVFFYSLPSVEHELLAPARQDTQPLPQLGSDGEEDDSEDDSEDQSATKKMRLMAQPPLPYTSRESDVDEKEEDKEDEREEEKEKDDDESDKEEGKEEDKEEVETDKEDEEEEEKGNENSTEEHEEKQDEKQDEEKQEDKDKEDK